jgi:N6-L-threonylcarbamoyladenine synthase
MKKHLDYEIIGQTLDDAAGEAFDKVARILGMSYPGGPAVALKAVEFKPLGSNSKIKLPRPMIKSGDYNFSFSGLKTAVLYETKKHPELMRDERYIAEICHEFQQSAIDVLVSKTISAAKKFKPKSILMAGGVSANLELRKQLEEAVEENFKNVRYSTPDFSYSLDNATMIAIAGYYRWTSLKDKKSLLNSWKTLEAKADLKLTR